MQYYYALGRRKEASARVRLYTPANEPTLTISGKTYEKGQIVVNDRLVEQYFPGEVAKRYYMEPFRTTNSIGRFITTVKVDGGGLHGQLEAVVHGIARALTSIDSEKFRPALKKHGFLTRDPRAKQRRKAGFAGKARKKKQSPKR
ncbi:30S ribosomal protein S9 [Candidatus Gottesmanbacteria bacterium]|nr:30S ribosomal protein S9 [Candidatus Gottesmanbacteria bacterium]